MDFGTQKLLSKGQDVSLNIDGRTFKGKVKEISLLNFEPEYLIQFEDGTAAWLNNVKIRNLLNRVN